jgi:MtaA/CmuA family methyltransferase
MNGRERILGLLEDRPIDRLPLMPITMQFAADFIGVPYRDYSMNYRVLVEGQLRVSEAFGFDYVNCMSDPAREAADCGAVIQYFENQPAAIVEMQARLANKCDLTKLRIPDPLGGGRMHNAVKGIALFKERLRGEKLIEGWIEGPCAEGADLRGINAIMLDFFDEPQFVRDLFEFVVEMELRYARSQIDAGADMIGIGDAVASLVGPDIYEEFIWPYEKRLVDGIHAFGAKARLHICGNTCAILEPIGRLGCDVVDLDSLSPVAEAREKTGANQVLLGNVNPVAVLRNGTPAVVRQIVEQCHYDAGARFIVGAGCEVPRDTPHRNLRTLCQYAQANKCEPLFSVA